MVEKTRDVRVPTTQLYLSPSISSLHVLPISRMSVYIFLTTFFLILTVKARSFPSCSPSLSFFRAHMPVESFHCASLSLPFLLFPSYGNVYAFFTPKSGYFCLEKKKKRKKRVFVTRCTRVRFWPVCKRSGSKRTSIRRGEKNDAEEGC